MVTGIVIITGITAIMAVGDRADTDTVPHTTAVDTTAMLTTVIAAVDAIATMIGEAMIMVATVVETRDHVVTGKTITFTVTNRSGPVSPEPETDRRAHRTGTLVIAGGSTIHL